MGQWGNGWCPVKDLSFLWGNHEGFFCWPWKNSNNPNSNCTCCFTRPIVSNSKYYIMTQWAGVIREFLKHLSRGDICHTRGIMFVILIRLQSSEKVFTQSLPSPTHINILGPPAHPPLLPSKSLYCTCMHTHTPLVPSIIPLCRRNSLKDRPGRSRRRELNIEAQRGGDDQGDTRIKATIKKIQQLSSRIKVWFSWRAM